MGIGKGNNMGIHIGNNIMVINIGNNMGINIGNNMFVYFDNILVCFGTFWSMVVYVCLF